MVEQEIKEIQSLRKMIEDIHKLHFMNKPTAGKVDLKAKFKAEALLRIRK